MYSNKVHISVQISVDFKQRNIKINIYKIIYIYILIKLHIYYIILIKLNIYNTMKN